MKTAAVILSFAAALSAFAVSSSQARQPLESGESSYYSQVTPVKTYIGNWLCFKISNGSLIPALFDQSLLVAADHNKKGEQQTISIKPDSLQTKGNRVFFSAVYWINSQPADPSENKGYNQLHFEAQKVIDCTTNTLATLKIVDGPQFDEPLNYFVPSKQEGWMSTALCDGDKTTLLARLVERHALLSLNFDDVINIPGPGMHSLATPIIGENGKAQQFKKSPYLNWHRHQKSMEENNSILPSLPLLTITL